MIDCDGTDKLTIALIICWSGKDTVIEDEIKQAVIDCTIHGHHDLQYFL